MITPFEPQNCIVGHSTKSPIAHLIAAKAKENLVTHTKNGYKQLCQNSDNPVDTKKELSKLAGVSHDTISRIEKIAAKAKESYKSNVGRPSKSPQNSATISNVETRKPPFVNGL